METGSARALGAPAHKLSSNHKRLILAEEEREIEWLSRALVYLSQNLDGCRLRPIGGERKSSGRDGCKKRNTYGPVRLSIALRE